MASSGQEEAADTPDPAESSNKSSKDHRLVSVNVPKVANLDSYLDYPPDHVVSRVLDEVEDEQGALKYSVRFGSNYEDLVSRTILVVMQNPLIHDPRWHSII